MVHVGSGRRCVMDTLLAPAGLGRSAVRHDRRCHPFGVVPGRGSSARRGCGWAVDGARWGFPRQRRRVGAPGALESRSPARRRPATVLDYRELPGAASTPVVRLHRRGAYEELTLRANVARPGARAAQAGRDARRVAAGEGSRGARPAARNAGDSRSRWAWRDVRPAAEVQAHVRRGPGVPFVESTLSICSIEQVPRRCLDPTVVSAVRNARPRVRRGIHAAPSEVAPRARGLSGPGGRRSASARRPQRGRWQRLDLGAAAARARHSDPPRLGSRCGRQRKAAYVRQPRGSGTPSRHPGGVQRMVAPSSNRAPPRMTSRGSVSTSTAGWWSGWCSTRRTPVAPSTPAWMASWSRTTEDGSSTRCARPCARPPDVIDAVGGRAEVLVDGGIRTGLDVVEMIALGAVP